MLDSHPFENKATNLRTLIRTKAYYHSTYLLRYWNKNWYSYRTHKKCRDQSVHFSVL